MGCCQSASSSTIDHSLPGPASSLRQSSSAYAYGKSITSEQLTMLRDEFWNTRVGGDINMWQALRTASEAVISNDMELARAILEASEITITNSLLATCYDISGHKYIIPQYCTCNPKELTSDNSVTPDKKKTVPGKSLKLNIRICDVNIFLENALTSNSILELKQLICDYTKELDNNNGGKRIPNCDVKRQRLMLMGKELKDNQRLEDIKIDENKVLQVFLRAE